VGAKEMCAATWLLLAPAAIAAPTAQAAHPKDSSPSVYQQTAQAVARDLKLGLATDLAGNLEVLPPMAFLPPSNRLHVTSLRSAFRPGTWLLRLNCDHRDQCLPFYAVLHYAELDPNSLPQFPDSSRASQRAPDRGGTRKESSPPLALRGAEIELVEELSGMRLRVKAVCLQSGQLGERIRVRNLSTNRVLLATVAGEHLVRVQR